MIFLIVENEPRIKLLHQKEGPHKADHSLRETPRAAAVSSLASDGETLSACSLMVRFQVLVHYS